MMLKLESAIKNQSTNPLQRKIPKHVSEKSSSRNHYIKSGVPESYEININLESIHYTGQDYGYGWTFVISTLQRHWISNRIHIQRGRESRVNKDIYHNEVNTRFNNLQHLPITICAQHSSGFKLETTLRLQPSSFKQNISPKSIYTNVDNSSDGFKFHELHTIAHDDAQFMFVLSFEVSPKEMSGYTN